MVTAIHKASFAQLCKDPEQVWNTLENKNKMVVVRRRGHKAMLILPVDEVDSLMETIHLIKSPANLAVLEEALAETLSGKLKPSTIDEMMVRAMKYTKSARSKK